jgi:hypothetical protein
MEDAGPIHGVLPVASVGRQAVKECNLPKETCFEGETHKKFLLYVDLGQEFEETGMDASGEVTFSPEVAIDF